MSYFGKGGRFLKKDKQNFTLFRSDVLSKGAFEQVLISPGTLLTAAKSRYAKEKVDELLGLLDLDDFDRALANWHNSGMNCFGDHWDFCDSLHVLNMLGHMIQPENYLEIGVRRGKSVCSLVFRSPRTNLFMFDLWEEYYSGMPNGSPDFVDSQLDSVGHKGSRNYFKGDTKNTLQRFLKEYKYIKFDAIFVDGDHSKNRAKRDLKAVYPLLKIGGILCFDDICHPYHMYLKEVWDDFISTSNDLIDEKYIGLGRGVAVAVKLDIKKRLTSTFTRLIQKLY